MNKRNYTKLREFSEKDKQKSADNFIRNKDKNKKFNCDSKEDINNDTLNPTDKKLNIDSKYTAGKETRENSDTENNNMDTSCSKFSNNRNPYTSKQRIKQNFKPNIEKSTFKKAETSKRYFNKAKRDTYFDSDFKDNANQKCKIEKPKEKFEKSKPRKSKLNFDDDEKITRDKNKKLKSGKQKDKTLKSDNKSAIRTTSLTVTYLSSGKEENSGVEASYKSLRAAEHTFRKLDERSNKRKKKLQKKQTKINNRIDKKESNLFYKKNLAEFKKTANYQKSSKAKQFFKRRRYKKQISKKYKNSRTNRMKKYAKEGTKKFTTFIKARNMKLVVAVLAVVILIFLLSNIGSSLMNMLVGVTGNTLSTNYLSDKDTLTITNQEFSSYEYALQHEIDNIKENYPDYDSYRIRGDSVGHDVNQLLSYLTAKNGNFKFDDKAKSELRALFNKMYKKKYTSRTIIKYDLDGDPYDYTILTLTITKKSIDDIAKEEFSGLKNNLVHYKALVEASGGMGDYFGGANGDLSEIVNNSDFNNPGLTFTNEKVKALFYEAEKHIGKRYVFGANGPANFDCSSFVCWSYTKSGVKYMPRTTAQAIFDNYCIKVSVSDARAGDIIFFTGTYDSGSPISHVGIYAGGGYMLHAGDPIKYANLNCKYWKDHFYTFGRLFSTE